MAQTLSVIFFGTPDFAAASLEALIRSNHTVKAVVTAPDKPAGRGKKLKAPAVKEFALKHDLPVMQPANLKDESFLNELKNYNADIFAVVAFRMLPEKVWNMPPHGTVNVHASLLPQYRGAAPINRAIMNGEHETGVTTFKLQHEIDTGDLLLSEKEKITAEDTAGTLHDRLMVKGANLLVKTLDGLAQDTLKPKQQSEVSGSDRKLKTAPKIHKHDCLITSDMTAEEIVNHIRGLSPYPGAFVEFVHESGKTNTVKVYRSEPDSTSAGTPGTLRIENKELILTAKTGSVLIKELKPQGKKVMNVNDYLNGVQNDKPVKIKS